MALSDYLTLDLPVLNAQKGRAVPKGESRLQVKAREDKQDVKAEDAWKKAVRKRDQMKCRWCKRTVVVCLDLIPERAEVHHVSGRVVKAIKFDRKNGLLLCSSCHERVTGKVSERHLVESSHVFTVAGVSYINADKPVKFTRIA